MSLPNLSGTGRLTADIELRYAPSGKAVASMRLAFNSRRKDDNGQYVDGDTFYVQATAFGRLAENAAESFSKGQELVVSGRLKTDQWQDKNDGLNRSAPSLLLDSIGGSCGLDTVTVNRVERGGTYRDGSSVRPTGDTYGDPWGAEPAGVGQSSDEAPW